MRFSYLLGVVIKAFIEIELLAMLLKSIFAVFLKRDHPICNILLYMTEPVIRPVRVLFTKVGLFKRAPIDMSFCFAFVIMAALDMLFGAWF